MTTSLSSKMLLRGLSWLAFTLALTEGVAQRSMELVYDTEAAKLSDSVPKYISMSGCYFLCKGASCSLLENETDNLCMLVKHYLEKKGGNLREGHFDDKYYTRLPDDRNDAKCRSRNHGGYENFTSDYDSAANGPITGYQVWYDRYPTGISFRYGNVWAPAHGTTLQQPSFYVQLARDEVMTSTVTRRAMWVDNISFFSSYRPYPHSGKDSGSPATDSGKSLRYVGAGVTDQAINYRHSTYILVSGIKFYYICM